MTGPQPAPRRDTGMAYDPIRDRIVAVDGEGLTWALTPDVGQMWSPLPVTNYASTGFDRAIYDPLQDRILMVSSSMQVFELSMANPTAWTLVAITGAAPPARAFFAAVHDAIHNRLIVYGGGPYNGILNDIWALDLDGPAIWTQIDPTGTPPPPTWGPLAAYDSDRDQLIVGMGAVDANYAVNSNLYSVNLSGIPHWTALAPSGTLPPPRMMSSCIYDPGSARVVMFSGFPVAVSDLWELRFTPEPTWAVLAAAGTAPRYQWSSATAFRTRTGEMILFGGHNGGDFTDTWALTLAAPAGPPAIFGVSPLGGIVGAPVTITGARLTETTEVTFNGVTAPIHSAGFDRVETEVPPGATTGPVQVTTPDGVATSPLEFFVGSAPELTDVEPDSARAGETVLLHGSQLAATTNVRFGGTGAATFEVLSDTLLSVTIDSLATSGPITVVTRAASVTSAFEFLVIADDPRPRLLGVRDVRGDQGGKVMLTWRASDFDQTRYKVIRGYRVWRRAPAAGVALAGQALPAGWMAMRPAEGGASDPPIFWESLVELPAAFLKGYAYAAATLQDSTDAGNPYTAYFVQAITGDPFVFYNSSPDSGYSVDNLAPPTPAPFTVNYGPQNNTLHWRGRPVADLRGYQVYRGESDEFVPSSVNLVATTMDTNFVDVHGDHYYKLAAIDVHGNRSRYAAVAPDRPVATLAEFFGSERSSGRLTMTWYSGGNSGLPARVYRRTEDTDWEFRREILADGLGYLKFVDGAVDDRTRYGYRLGILEPGEGELMLAEAWVDPLAVAFAWSSRMLNPSPGGRVELSFALPVSGVAEIRLFDIAGREIERQSLASDGGGEQSVTFGDQQRLRAGVYLVRATSGGVVLRRRVVVLN